VDRRQAREHMGEPDFPLKNAVFGHLAAQDSHHAPAAGAAAAALGANWLRGELSRLENGGAVGNEGGPSGGRKGDLVSHSCFGFRNRGKKALRQFLGSCQSNPGLRREALHLRRDPD